MSGKRKEGKVRKISGVKGMNDILPVDAPLWDFLEATAESVLKSYGYQQIRTPIVEETALFARGLGTVTDIVEKEMYSFEDALNGDNLTLRPESTAGVVRAVLEHKLTYNGPKRLWYVGAMFRHERPQRGRYRQFHQIGAEAVGFAGPDIDAELILLCQRLWDDLGLQHIHLELNSIGDAEERSRHRTDLIAYFEKHKNLLDEDAQRRLYTNPLRILDTKNLAMQDMVNSAPKLMEYLGRKSLAHFDGLQTILRDNNIPFTVNTRLVRGMDYYNRTVFEWISNELGAQGTVCGGGRYDPLFEMSGGRPTPACGFAMGAERLIELLRAGNTATAAESPDVYVVHHGKGTQLEAFRIAETLRGTGLTVILHCPPDGMESSFKSQMKRADDSGAVFAVILGEDEVKGGYAGVKALRSGMENNQQQVSLDGLTDYLIDQMVGRDSSCEQACSCDHIALPDY
ncbi:MAG: histidine--tRNA ligase [Burkholderiaceae bacterium]|jgi:histidyl-tRNA synthetase|nr:histidine--tRNA ligase [Burkholderiaceae bacterium]